MYCSGCGVPLDNAPEAFCPSCGESLIVRRESDSGSASQPASIGSHGSYWSAQRRSKSKATFALLATVAVIGVATLASVITRRQDTPVVQVQPRPHVETPAPEPAPRDTEQARLAKMRESIATQLHQTLNDAGYDITVGEVGDTLLLHGDVYNDTATRVESLQMLRSIANDRLCPWGFRQVNIGAGLFSGTDYTYSLHCAERAP